MGLDWTVMNRTGQPAQHRVMMIMITIIIYTVYLPVNGNHYLQRLTYNYLVCSYLETLSRSHWQYWKQIPLLIHSKNDYDDGGADDHCDDI